MFKVPHQLFTLYPVVNGWYYGISPAIHETRFSQQAQTLRKV
jgi:hypothetical protein